MNADGRGLEARLLNLWYGPSPLKYLLWPLGALYGLLATLRRRLYINGVLERYRAECTVIVVGNLTVGGTGKTPLVIWLASRLKERGLRVGLICRGYGGAATTWPQLVTNNGDAAMVGDEAVVLARVARCPVVAGPDRRKSADKLVGHVDVIISDDGLQHYRLERDVELAVVDGIRGVGNGLCLPAGPLREPAGRLREVDAIVVNGGDWGHAGVLRMNMEFTELTELSTGRRSPLSAFRGRRVHAVAGIGHPERFFDQLSEADIIVEPHAPGDHARITPDDLEFGDNDPVILTEKDAVKLPGLSKSDVWSIGQRVVFDGGDDARLLRMLTRHLPGRH